MKKDKNVSQKNKRAIVRAVMHRAATDSDFAAQRWQQEQSYDFLDDFSPEELAEWRKQHGYETK